jgi:sulfide:quinone oxidoreductase
MVGLRKTSQVLRPFSNLRQKGIALVKGSIEQIDPLRKTVRVNGTDYQGDYIVISLGVDYSTDHLLDQRGFSFYSLGGAERFYEKLKDFKGGKIAVLISSLPFKCPAAPYEAGMLIQDFIRRKGLADKTEVSIYTPEPYPMPVAGKEIAGQVRNMLESKGVKYYPDHQISEVSGKELKFTNGTSVRYDLLAYTPRHQPPEVVKAASLVGKSGWVEVNRHTLETTFPDVYAIGDVTTIPLEMGKPLPKAGVFAHYQAETVAQNILLKIAGEDPDKKFDGHGQCFLEIGSGEAGYATGNFYQSPLPAVKMKKHSVFWHWAKVWLEKYWFYKFFRSF